ncbi:hypothetical protein ACERK3_09625 [Phycisphaerales bacterium AB-hyl4]|uniref:Uncharacterized protein n=1 Tax=Natronomicrosphaera hydrolytica TaxID=3242702 RepID=A0ABV4U7R5_9BACT
MNQRSLASLILINAVLLAALVVTAFSPSQAEAQFAGPRQFLMIAGEVQARGPQAAVYIIEMQSSQMVVARFDSRTGDLNFIDGRRVSDDLRDVMNGR